MLYLYCLEDIQKHIEDIYFFELNTKFILTSVLKHQNFHECTARVNLFDVFSIRDEIYLVFTQNSKFSFFILVIVNMQCLTHKKELLKI